MSLVTTNALTVSDQAVQLSNLDIKDVKSLRLNFAPAFLLVDSHGAVYRVQNLEDIGEMIEAAS